MKWVTSIFLGILLILLLVACNLPEETIDLPSDSSVEEVDKEIDYCGELPAGTRVTWFDLSTFIFIPGSSFQMGFEEPDEVDHKPVHDVALGPHWMHETEVSNREYATCVTAGTCTPPEPFTDTPYWFEDVESLDDPVVGVTWEQADTYCHWLGTRLPTEAEWELAARGTKSTLYPWGDSDPDCDHANFTGCQDPEPDQPTFTGLLTDGVGPFEMLDLAGNVNEWVSDWYGQDYYANSPDVNPTGPGEGDQRVFRGGGYLTAADGLMSYLRQSQEPDQAQPDLGFRCAWSCADATTPPALCSYTPAIGDPPSLGERPPTPKPDVDADGWCEWRKDTQVAGVTVSGSDAGMYEVVGGGVDCAMEGGVLVCTGGGIVPEGSVTLTICPDCAPGFYFDQASGMCRSMLALNPDFELLAPEGDDCPPGMEMWLGMCVPEGFVGPPEPEDCPPGEIWYPVIGCADLSFPPDDFWDGWCPPLHKPSSCGCIPFEMVCIHDAIGPLQLPEPPAPGEAPDDGISPPDWMPGWPFEPGDTKPDPDATPLPEDCAESSNMLQCAPMHFPTLVDGCWVCAPWQFPGQDCPEGYVYDVEANCCVPQVPEPTCPRGTYYDPATHSCIPIVFQGQDCLEITVKIPGCGQKPRPTPEVTGCARWTTYNDCTAHANEGCKWNRTTNTCDGP